MAPISGYFCDSTVSGSLVVIQRDSLGRDDPFLSPLLLRAPAVADSALRPTWLMCACVWIQQPARADLMASSSLAARSAPFARTGRG